MPVLASVERASSGWGFSWKDSIRPSPSVTTMP
jgi:hypothetical protein